MGNLKYPGLLLVLLLPALISGASAAVYVENASIFNLSLNTAPVELNSSFDSVQPRIFTEHAGSLLWLNLSKAPVELNSSLNAVRPRIFTEHLDTIMKNNLNKTPDALNSSLAQIRPRIFAEHLDSLLINSLDDTPSALDSSLSTIRPRIFTEHLDALLKSDLSDTPGELDASTALTRPRIFTEHVDSLLVSQLNVTPSELDSSVGQVKPRIFIESADMLWFKSLINITPDTTPPDSVANLNAYSAGATWINWTWDNPNNTDFGHVIIYLNGAWKANTSADHFNATDLSPDTTYEIGVKTVDIWGNVNESLVTDTAKTLGDIVDTTPPASVSNPSTTAGNFYINNTWVNPEDADFSYVWFRYSNDTTLQNVSNPTNYLNLTWSPHYTQNISAQTVDNSGNVNQTKVWFNATIPNNAPVQAAIGDKIVTEGDLLTFSVSVTDADSDTITYGTNATGGSLNPATGEYSWQTGSGDSGIYVWYFNSSDGFGGVASETITITVTVSAPTEYIPPDPVNLASTQGNFWINHTWQAGAGNATDSYNVSVNGVWTNGTTNTYSNTSVGPHGWSNITVWAYNNSGSGSLSSASVSQNTQVANNVPIQEPIGDKTIDENQPLQFTVSATDADLDTITYGTNATKGIFNTTTGEFSWTPGYGDAGVYVWYFNSSDGYGGVASETITVTVNGISITSSLPVTDPTTTVGTAQTFEINLNRIADVTWYIDGSMVQNNLSAISAYYTNSTADIGVYNITVTASDNYDSVSRTWSWTVTEQPTYNVSGYVFDNYGLGLADVDVLVHNGSHQNTTIASGYYLITGLLNGTYNFSYSKVGFDTGYLEVTISGADIINVNKMIYDTIPPAQVTGLINDTPTQTTVNLSWNPITDANYYQVFRDFTSFGYTQNTYWNDTGLTADTLYEYVIRANDSYNNWGQNSSILSINTAPAADTTPPAGPVRNINKGTSYTTIQAAIDDASPGDEIQVDSGTYYENVNITKQLVLRGIDNGGGMPVVDARMLGSAMNVTDDGVIIEGFSLVNTSWGNWPDYNAGLKVISNNNVIQNINASNNVAYGIYLQYSNNTILQNSSANNSYYGIYVSHSNNVTLTENTAIFYNSYGIVLSYSNDSNLERNIASNNYRGYSSSTGIRVEYSNNNTIRGNTATNNSDWYGGYGIYLYSSSYNFIVDNNASNNGGSYYSYYDGTGVYIGWNSSYNVLINNTANNNTNTGIALSGSSNSTLQSNLMSGNRYNFGAGGYNNIDTSNLVDGKPIFYLVGASDTIIDSSSNAGTVYCIGCNNITVKDLILINNSNGIYFYKTNNSKIQNNYLRNNGYGIYIDLSSNNNTIKGNNITNNQNSMNIASSSSNIIVGNIINSSGISLSGSSNNTIGSNTLTNSDQAVYTYNSNNNTVESNNASSNGYGIWLQNSRNNTLKSNFFSNNKYNGISLSGSSNNTIIRNNISSNNFNGISIYSSSNNTLYQNNLVNNTNYNAYDYDGKNQWDSGTLGNYYSNFDEHSEGCSDLNGDGICDSKYSIPGGSSVDRYPLTKPWVPTPNIGPVHNINKGINYTSIQAAINDASPGDVILVDNGTYFENVNVNKRLTLRGIDNGSGIPVVDGRMMESAIRITANGVMLEGFDVRNSSSGIYVSSNNVILRNNSASNNYQGIYLRYSNNNTLSNNTMSLNKNYGIYLEISTNNTLTSNNISTNMRGLFVWGNKKEDFNNNIDSTNKINGKPVYYIFDQENVVLDQIDAGHLSLAYSSNLIIKNSNISGDGVSLLYSGNNALSYNTADSNWIGILLVSSFNNTLSGNNASNNDYGVYLYYSNNNTISQGTSNLNNQLGIYLYNAKNNTLNDNNILNNQYGVYLSSSNNNSFFHNNFINNTNQAIDDSYNNTWDNGYPSGGNYWSDYANSDNLRGPHQDYPPADGIGDVPYNISGSAGAKDNYPFMKENGWFENIIPPDSITELNVSSLGTSWINWTWKNPDNIDFSHVIIYVNGILQKNVTLPVNYYNATDLTADTEYTIGTHTVDLSGNINQTWVNHTARTALAAVVDTTPPASVTDLHAYSAGATWINWTWTNPSDPDFDHTMIYLDGSFAANVSETYYNATDLQPGTIHTISTRTVDISGNVNQTWVNNTAITAGHLPGGLNINVYKPEDYSVYPVGEKLRFEIDVQDAAGNPVVSGISAYAVLTDPNDISKQVILSKDADNLTGEYIVSREDARGIWTINITAYNDTNSGQASVKLLFTGAYFIQPSSDKRSYIFGETANFTARVAKPGDIPQTLTDKNLSLNLSIYPLNSSIPVLESVEMMFNNTAGEFYRNVDTSLLGPGLFTVLFIGNDTSGDIEVASLSIGVSEDFTVTVGTDRTYYDRDEPVSIYGSVRFDNNSPLSNANISLQVNLQGFTRSYSTITNGAGEFNYTFQPFAVEAGNYTVKATVTNIGLLRTAENYFTIHGLYLSPSSAAVNMSEDSTQIINFTLYNLGETILTGITAGVKDLDISDNVYIIIDPASVPTELGPHENASITLQINAGKPVPDEAVFLINVTTDQMSNEFSELHVKLFPPTPIVALEQDNLIIGLNKNQTAIKTVKISNIGYGVLQNVTLHQPEHNWMRITSNTSLGNLQPGENITFDIHIQSYNVNLGTYYDTVNITSDNHETVQVDITAFITDMANGSLLFYVEDALGRNISEANILLIDETTYQEYTAMTNSTGYALISGLPAGRYIYEVSPIDQNILPQLGSVVVEPMDIPKKINVTLQVSFIDFEWDIIPTSIEDWYQIILRMRFETDVPVPIIIAFPPYLEYDLKPGEVRYETLTVANLGLVSIYNVSITSAISGNVKFTPMVSQIEEIKAKSSVQLPYIVELSSTADTCQRFSGRVDITGKYLHFIDGRAVASYAGTTVPLVVRTPNICGPPIIEKGSIAGMVTNASDGAPIYEAVVTVKGRSNKTDGSGDYTINGIPVGIYTVTASKKGYYASSKTAAVSKDATTIVDLQLEPIPETAITTGAVTGTVTDLDTGERLEGAYIVTDGGYATTDQSGSYTILDVPTGVRNVRAEKTGYYSASKKVTVNESDVTIANFQLSRIVFPPLPPIPQPDFSFCINGYGVGMTPERLKDLPWLIWINKINENTTVRPAEIKARNNNIEGAIGLSDALAIAFTKSLGLGDVLKLRFKTKMDIEIDLKSMLEEAYGKEIPAFKIWTGTFDPKQINPEEISRLNLNEIPTSYGVTIGVSLPEVTGGLGGLVFEYGPYPPPDKFNCLWFIPLAYSEVDGGSINIVLPPLPDFPEWPGLPNGGSADRKPPRPVITHTIHETVMLSISQNATTERDAFWAGLGIRNRMSDNNIENVRVRLQITDENGLNANEKFFIRAPQLDGISNIDGTGRISPLKLAKAQWLIIPKSGAGGTNGQKYNISADITYSVDGIRFEVLTKNIEILVNPQPQLTLDYYIPSDVIANKPFKLAVRVTNDGYGTARNFSIDTAQPVIYNPSGLLIDFEIIRSAL